MLSLVLLTCLGIDLSSTSATEGRNKFQGLEFYSRDASS
jgi:hypothetical protein